MELRCPKCGISSREIPFSGPFCIKCKPVNIKCPKRMEFIRCSKCGRVRLKGNWVKADESRLSEEVISKCKGEFIGGSYDFRKQEATFFVGDKNRMFPVKRRIKVSIVKNICQECSRKSGGYFEGIIQLRGPKGKVMKACRTIKKMLAKTTFITKEEAKKEGLDLYVGSSKAVVELLAELHLRAKMSKKLAGQKEGKRLYRTTFLIRL
ncbi:hypothetical protein GF412_03500 [Candidatus Micrarchaeota archaeon]|nr:hypothetical protein [Candidatus Micrarchaeota archaeon]MBD3418017.1 hypothetical protein [Candidatus Micrarchaeota archaeon]